MEISGDDVLVTKTRSLLNSLALDAGPRARNSCRKKEVAHQVKQSAKAQALSLTQLVQRMQPLRTALDSQLLAGKNICNGGGHHMKLECKPLEALGDAATDSDSTSGGHLSMNSDSVCSMAITQEWFRMNSDSVCSMADTQEWMSESDWLFH